MTLSTYDLNGHEHFHLVKTRVQ